MYVIELAIKMSPMPVSVQRKEQAAAEALYQQVRQTMEQGQPRLLELSCEKMEGKRVSVLSSEVLSVQIYEKTASGGGSKRPGFAFDGLAGHTKACVRSGQLQLAQWHPSPRSMQLQPPGPWALDAGGQQR